MTTPTPGTPADRSEPRAPDPELRGSTARSALRSFLSGPHLLRNALIERVRNLPFGGEILVTEGEIVRPETVVAHLNPRGYLHFINVAKELDIPFHLAAQCVVKAEGEPVRRGEVVAVRPAALGFFFQECRSPADGVIEKIYPSGHVTVRSHPVPVSASLSGRVVEAVPGDRVTILTAGTLVQGVFGLGGETHGLLHVLTRGPAGIPAGAVVVTPHRATGDLIRTCIDAGARALVAPGCHLRELEILGCRPAPDNPDPFGRGARVPLTLVLTEGFGDTVMSDRLYRALVSLDGREASVSGYTQLRAGVERPEVVVPTGEPPAGRPAGAEPIHIGRRTRI